MGVALSQEGYQGALAETSFEAGPLIPALS
jgi:hypothetical protein